KSLWVTVPVQEEVSTKITSGRIADVAFDALPGRKFKGSVVQLNPSSDPMSHQLIMRLSIDNSQNLIKPGMFARVQMELDRSKSAIAVKREAVQYDKKGPYVTVVDADNAAHKRPVVLGASDAEGFAVISGLAPGERVVILSAVPVKNGQTVRVSDSGGVTR